MYITSIIEGYRQYRKVTKTKSVFPSDTALEKMLYLASENVVKNWDSKISELESGSEAVYRAVWGKTGSICITRKNRAAIAKR